MGGATHSSALAVLPEVWVDGTPEARATLEDAEAVACRVRGHEGDLPVEMMLNLRQAEGFLVAARSSALTGRWRATVTFGRIAEEEFRAILRAYAGSAVPSVQPPSHTPVGMSVIPVSPDGPL